MISDESSDLFECLCQEYIDKMNFSLAIEHCIVHGAIAVQHLHVHVRYVFKWDIVNIDWQENTW